MLTYYTRQISVFLSLAERSRVLARPSNTATVRDNRPRRLLYLKVNPLSIHGHVDVKTAEFVLQRFGRHFRIPYLKLFDVFILDADQFRDKSFQQVGIFHKQHFEQYIRVSSWARPFHIEIISQQRGGWQCENLPDFHTAQNRLS